MKMRYRVHTLCPGMIIGQIGPELVVVKSVTPKMHRSPTMFELISIPMPVADNDTHAVEDA